MQPSNSLVTLLRAESGYVNKKGDVYDKNGVFIDFPRELGSKTRGNFDILSVTKRFPRETIGCIVHERRNYSYYHWTYETLPKLIYLSNNRQDIKVDKIYFHCGFLGTAYQRQALRNLGFNWWQLLDAKRIDSLMGKEIIAIKLNDEPENPSHQLCQTIRSAFIKNPSQETWRRIYLTRNSVKSGRKVSNESELRELLKTYGFEIVVADNLTVANQAKLFNESKYIISPHGAALANIVFCTPKTVILELHNRIDQTTWSPLYQRIAKTCDLELIPLGPKEEMQSGDNNPHRRDFIADLSAIEHQFTQLSLTAKNT